MFGWGRGSSAPKPAPQFPDMKTPHTDTEYLEIAKQGYQDLMVWLYNNKEPNLKWQPAGHAKEVEIFKMDIEGSDIALSKASGEVDMSAADMFDFLAWNDGEVTSEPTNAAWEVLHKIDERTTIVYSAHTAPFPITTREFVFVRSCLQDGENYFIIGIGINHDRPVEHGRVRGKLTIGAWAIEPLGDDKKRCRITRVIHADPKGAIPHFLLNYSINKTGEQVLTIRAAALAWQASKVKNTK